MFGKEEAQYDYTEVLKFWDKKNGKGLMSYPVGKMLTCGFEA